MKIRKTTPLLNEIARRVSRVLNEQASGFNFVEVTIDLHQFMETELTGESRNYVYDIAYDRVKDAVNILGGLNLKHREDLTEDYWYMLVKFDTHPSISRREINSVFTGKILPLKKLTGIL